MKRIMPRLLKLSKAILIVLSLIIGSIGGMTIVSADNANVPAAVIPPEGSYDPAGQIGMAADAIASSQFASIYGGMKLANNGTQVDIYLTQLDSNAEKTIIGTAPANDFAFFLTHFRH